MQVSRKEFFLGTPKRHLGQVSFPGNVEQVHFPHRPAPYANNKMQVLVGACGRKMLGRRFVLVVAEGEHHSDVLIPYTRQELANRRVSNRRTYHFQRVSNARLTDPPAELMKRALKVAFTRKTARGKQQ